MDEQNILDRLAAHEIWCIDAEYRQTGGDRPEVWCVCGVEARSGRTFALTADDLACDGRPYDMGPSTMTVAFNFVAEGTSLLALGLELPERVIDLYAEFRLLMNGRRAATSEEGGVAGRYGLLNALAHFRLPAVSALDKERWRQLAATTGPVTDQDWRGLMDYCLEDAQACRALLPFFVARWLAADDPGAALSAALFRGRYMRALAQVVHAGTPVDAGGLRLLARHRQAMRRVLIREAGLAEVFPGMDVAARPFEAWLDAHGIMAWPRTATGLVRCDRETLEEMAAIYPEVRPILEVKSTLGKVNIHDYPIGHDGRLRTSWFPFGTRTGRNRPPGSVNIFAAAKWARGFIRPEPGSALIYLDWKSQEIGIAGALSDDTRWQAVYRSPDDVYLAFGIAMGKVPLGASKLTHAVERRMLKALVLGLNYGMSEAGLARRLGIPPPAARRLIEEHRAIFAAFWRWSDGAVNRGTLVGRMATPLGWEINDMQRATSCNAWRNWTVQATGADMMRLAACLITEAGYELVALVHDAVLVVVPAEKAAEVAIELEAIMVRASADVLRGFALDADYLIVGPGQNLLSADEDKDARQALELHHRIRRIAAGLARCGQQ